MQARFIVEEVLRLITETPGSAEAGIVKAAEFTQDVIHHIKIASYREAGALDIEKQYRTLHRIT